VLRSDGCKITISGSFRFGHVGPGTWAVVIVPGRVSGVILMRVVLGPVPGTGPVFEFEWLTATRRWQGYALRSIFVAFLLGALVVTWSSGRLVPKQGTIRALADLGGLFYVAVIGTQLTLVLLAAPAATAGAICLDRARGTLTHLLVTDLTDSEIVLGKLAARLVPVLGLVFCALPVTALLTLLGGVDPDALLGAFVVTLGVAFLGCSLALVFSLWAGKTHEALMGTYAVWGLWLLGGPMVRTLSGASGLYVLDPPQAADPFYLAFAPYWWPGRVGWGDYLTFLGVTTSLSAALVLVAVLRLRAVCARGDVPKTRGRRPWAIRPFPAARARLARAVRCQGPSLDWNPVLWREWHRNQSSRWTQVVGTLFATLATIFSVISVSYGSIVLMVFVNAFQVSIGLLLLSVSAATSLAEERMRGSLDVLMTTPLSTREIVAGKWLGAFRRVPLLAVLPCMVVVCGGQHGIVKDTLGGMLLFGYVLACGAAVTSLGLATATWCSRLGRAVGLTVTAYVLTTVGWMFLVMALFNPNPFGWALITGSPFSGSISVTRNLCESRSAGGEGFPGWVFLWILIYAGLAVGLLAATLASFNHCLGRIENRFDPPGRPGLGPVKLVPIKEAAGPEFAELSPIPPT